MRPLSEDSGPLSFAEWALDHAAGSHWLIVGKGPSCSKVPLVDLGAYKVMALNHAVRAVDCDLAHAIDLDVITSLDEASIDRARHWVLPWMPHVENKAGRRNLAQCIPEVPALARLAGQGRLLWYNASTASEANPAQPIVPVRFFSAEAAVSLLAINGVKCIRTLGVDGGSSYANAFNDLSGSTLLANGRSSFDRQFESIAEAVFRHGLDFGPWDEEVPVRVFVATEPAQMLATKILEYSIRRRASISTEVHAICDFHIAVPEPRELRNRPRTPFSFQRFLIPEAAGLRGRAIYLDSDMQVFTDIRQLWTQPMNGAPLLSVASPKADGRRPQFSVMLLDCARLGWKIADIVGELDDGKLTYEQLMYEMQVAPGWRADIDPCWNSLERYDSDTALLHYTDMEMQPWISTRNPLAYLWVAELRHAINSGFVSLDYVAEDVRQGYARPSLLWQLQNDVDDPLLLPKSARALDRDYLPPFMALETRGIGSPWVSPGKRLRAQARDLVRRTGFGRVIRGVRNRLNR